MLYRGGVIAYRIFTLQEYGFLTFFCTCDLDLDPMTFIYELDPYPVEIYQIYKYKQRTSRLAKVIVCETTWLL